MHDQFSPLAPLADSSSKWHPLKLDVKLIHALPSLPWARVMRPCEPSVRNQ